MVKKKVVKKLYYKETFRGSEQVLSAQYYLSYLIDSTCLGGQKLNKPEVKGYLFASIMYYKSKI